MPFVSAKQRAWAHANPKELGGESKVAEWESETPSALPKYKHGTSTSPKLARKFAFSKKKKG